MSSVAAPRRLARLGILVVLVMGLLAFQAPRAEARTNRGERQMISLVNKARREAGRAPLRMSGRLSDLARRHSATMAARNRLYHNPRLARWMSRLPWRILGENVGVGPGIATLHQAFMASPGHRANVLERRFRQVGVGIVYRDGRVWVTVIFKG